MFIFKLKQSLHSIKYKSIFTYPLDLPKRFSSTSDYHVKLDCSSFSNINTDYRKEPLILMHGLFGYRKNFESIAKALAHKITNPVRFIYLY